MKRVLYGLMAGVLLCGAASFVFIPRMQQRSYTNGYEAGNRTGMSAGTSAGVEEGMAKLKVQQQAQHEHDSMVAARHHEQAMARARRKPKKVEKLVQNWHVIDNKIADPIPD